MPGLKAVDSDNFARLPGGLDRLDGILHEIHEYLDELIAIAEQWRKRRIILLPDRNRMRQPGFYERLHMREHDVDVDRLALGRTLVREHLHLVDEIANAIGLAADQSRQCAIVAAKRRLQQLRRAPDARQRDS